VSSKLWRSHAATITVDHQHRGGVDDDSGCAWDCDRKRDTLDGGGNGRVGYIRAAEITIGLNGWHPHFHPLIIWRGPAADAQAFADAVVTEWVHQVEKHGGEARGFGAQQLRVLDRNEGTAALAGYLTKATYEPARLALEVVWSQGKSGHGRAKETKSHWTLLAEIERGDFDAVERWVELEAATKGYRLISWSRGLRNFAGLNDERTDEEIAADEVGSALDTVCLITADSWRDIRDLPEVLSLTLDTLEKSGWEALSALFRAWGVEWTTVEALADVSGPENAAYARAARDRERSQESRSSR
jgi:hypothetical protein